LNQEKARWIIIKKLVLNVPEAAELLGIDKIAVYELCHTESFPAFRVGRRWLVSYEGLVNWINTQAGN